MSNQTYKYWGDPGQPGTLRAKAWKLANIRKVQVGGVTLYLHKTVAPLFKAFVQELNARGYRIDRGPLDDWGYANRDVRGRPGVKSNHAWGLAADLNATTNPMTNDGRTHTDLPSWISALAAKYGLRWGGDYTGRKDPMHFEYMGTPQEAQDLIAKLQKSSSVARIVGNPYRLPVVSAEVPARRGAQGDGVRWMQHQLELRPTGRFDETLVRAVMAHQKKYNLKVDGKVGPNTLNSLVKL